MKLSRFLLMKLKFIDEVIMKYKKIKIKSWNMDYLKTKTIKHNLGKKIIYIVKINIIIYSDLYDFIGKRYKFNFSYPDYPNGEIKKEGEIVEVNKNNIILTRRSGGFFDTSNFDDNKKNRGIIIFSLNKK